jgi:hypothetical protein
MDDATAQPPADDFARLLVVSGELGRARNTLALFDAAMLDCPATLAAVRETLDRIERAIRGR